MVVIVYSTVAVEITQFDCRGGFHIRPVVLVKPFVTADDQWSPLRCMVVIVRFTAAEGLPKSLVGVGAFDDPFVLIKSFDIGRSKPLPYRVWW